VPREVSRSANSSPENTGFDPCKLDPNTDKGRNLGTSPTRAKAEKHKRAVQYFKLRR
jgi:hypothetical protein